MNRIEFAASKLMFFFVLIAGAACLAVGAFFLQPEGLIRLLGVVFLCVGLAICVYSIRQILDKRPRLIIDDAGLDDRSIGVGKIAWRDIESVYVKTSTAPVEVASGVILPMDGAQVLCLRVAAPEKYLALMRQPFRTLVKINAMFGYTPLALNLSSIKGNPQDVIDCVAKRLDAQSRQKA